jgi:mannosyl-oligosaccharide glucosidase
MASKRYLKLARIPGVLSIADIILQQIIKRAQEILSPYKDGNPPDPSFVLQLPDEVYTASNLYAIQKSFEGEFQFDVFFESASSKHKLSCVFLVDSSDARA